LHKYANKAAEPYLAPTITLKTYMEVGTPPFVL